MTIEQFIKQKNLENSLLLGYYGGGNYGDELLLEVLMNLLSKKGVKAANVAYMPYCEFSTYHRDFGYGLFRANSVPKLLLAMIKCQSIIVGGGGIWGLDAKLQPLLMNIALFIGRWLLGKKVYLLGVGYYNSTNWYGHVGAWLAAKSANVIIGRDSETQLNFRRFKSQEVYLDADIAWHLNKIDSRAYKKQLSDLEKTLPIRGRTLFITLRRFSDRHKNQYAQIVGSIIRKYKDFNIVVGLLEPKQLDLQNYKLIESWSKQNANIQLLEFNYNPVALFLFLQKHRKQLAVISPQFHAIITAHMVDVPFLPLVYDNKVSALLNQIGISESISIYKLRASDVEKFVEGLGGA